MNDHPTSASSDDEGRPSREEVAPSNVVATDIYMVAATPDIVRCNHCGHILWSDLSVMLGIGPECRRRAA